MRTAQLALSIVVLAAAGGAGAAQVPSQAQPTTERPDIAALWIEPADLEQRDLFAGPPGGPPAPDGQTPFTFVAVDTSGKSPGFDVRDSNGVEWSVKLGEEAQSEVVASRILWAIGFHQPPLHYVTGWQMTGQQAGPQPGGRFRPEIATAKTVADRWDFKDNPFVGTRELNGLLVVQMMLNNWDLKDSNNKVYEVSDASGGPVRRYVVRDLGAALGHNRQKQWFRWLGIRASQGSKNDVADFERTALVDEVRGERVKFTYRGPNDTLVDNITTADVRWTANLMSRISDAQWRDAFRAGGYAPQDAERYIRKLKAKIAEGLALPERAVTEAARR